jgi:hypothetical protein
MPMLAENEKKFDRSIKGAKILLDDALTYFRKGNYDAALGALTQVGDADVPYLVYIEEEDRAGRIAKEFSDWFDENVKELLSRSIHFRR